MAQKILTRARNAKQQSAPRGQGAAALAKRRGAATQAPKQLVASKPTKQPVSRNPPPTSGPVLHPALGSSGWVPAATFAGAVLAARGQAAASGQPGQVTGAADEAAAGRQASPGAQAGEARARLVRHRIGTLWAAPTG